MVNGATNSITRIAAFERISDGIVSALTHRCESFLGTVVAVESLALETTDKYYLSRILPTDVQNDPMADRNREEMQERSLRCDLYAVRKDYCLWIAILRFHVNNSLNRNRVKVFEKEDAPKHLQRVFDVTLLDEKTSGIIMIINMMDKIRSIGEKTSISHGRRFLTLVGAASCGNIYTLLLNPGKDRRNGKSS
uniref:Uncharacterized protein n=1 Tax=Vespula pensylvanica TaxID=30213 RepID=A0A834UDU1_VESPE|nr:hypothetical protein H0235_002480 [Vespula pensylvanica]